MFFQEGLPIPIAIDRLKEQGYEVSILHVADECLKNGWSPETTVKKLREDFADSLEVLDVKQLRKFCYACYEDQRDMIFNSLFKSIEEAKSIIA